MAGPEEPVAVAEAGAWFEANWSPDLRLGDWWERLARSGWGFPAWPKEWFGRGIESRAARAVGAERLRRGVFGPPTGIATFLAAPTIFAHGTDDQKQRFLPGIASGRDIWCQLFSEPGAGSDMASLQTSAVRDGDEWVVNGQKVWTSGAQFSRFGILIARTDPDVPKHKGLTFFLIDMQQPGVEVRPLREMTGESSFNEVFLSDARVHDNDRLDALGEGWRVAMTTLGNERDPSNAGLASGGGSLIGKPDLDLTVAEYQRLRAATIDAFSFSIGGGVGPLLDGLLRSFGRGADPVTRQRFAAIKSMRDTQRWTAERAKASARAGAVPGPETSTLKLGGTRISRAIRDLGFAAMGPHGMLADDDSPTEGLFQKYAMFVQAGSIAGGSDEVQHNIIGERALGLPKEPDDSRNKPFRDVPVGTQRPNRWLSVQPGPAGDGGSDHALTGIAVRSRDGVDGGGWAHRGQNRFQDRTHAHQPLRADDHFPQRFELLPSDAVREVFHRTRS
jgi:alkylation response protein AidB-like acyl-CoA dehydrogenase